MVGINVEPYEEGLNYIVLAEKLISRNFKPYIVSLHAASAVSASAFEFITGASTALSTIFGAGTGSKLDIISASTDDKSALSGHTRQVQTWGITTADNLAAEIIDMSGDTVTSATNTYKEINDFAGYLYGSAASAGIFDAKGNIDIGQVGKVTNELFRIAANENTIKTARLWIPKNWRARIVNAHCGIDDTAAARSAGVLMYPSYFDVLHQAEDSTRDHVAFFHEMTQIDETVWHHTYGSDSTMSKLTFFGSQINAADNWNLHVTVLIWATKNLVSGQVKGIAGVG